MGFKRTVGLEYFSCIKFSMSNFQADLKIRNLKLFFDRKLIIDYNSQGGEDEKKG